jgi:hypothetical protein
MGMINTDLTKKQKTKLMIIGALLGFFSGLSFFVFKVVTHTNNANQIHVTGIYNEQKNI